MADQSARKRWILTHVTRVWTALFTLASLGAALQARIFDLVSSDHHDGD